MQTYFRIAPLVGQVARMDEHVSLRQLDGLVVCVRDADEASLSVALASLCIHTVYRDFST